MKRKAVDIEGNNSRNTDFASNDIKKITDNKIKKKLKLEKSLSDKFLDKYTKKSFPLKKDSKERNLKGIKCNATKKMDWLKLKQKKKELRGIRRAKKLGDDQVHSIIIETKQIYEKLRQSDCTSQNHIKLTRMLHEKLKTTYNRVILMRDMSRVIQCMIKHCETNIRQAIFLEIKSSIIEMSQSKYARNCIKVILKYGSQEIRREVISAFYGNIIKLMSNVVSAPIIEHIYITWCTDLDKMYFKQEFYGDMYKQAKDKTIKALPDVFENAKDMKSATLSAVKTNVIRILNKGFIDSTLLHTILWEFFCVCSPEDKNDLIVMLRDFVVTLSQTKMGAKVVMQCIWHGNNKDRKVIMKILKENVKEICMSEHGYIILLALFDCIDDTVLLKKIILTELQKDLVDIALNEYGKHVILYLVARRDSHYFPPSVVEYLQQGDNNSISKKPADVRAKELLEAINDPLLEAITANAAIWLSNSAIAMVTLAILKVGSGKKLDSTFESIAKFISNTDSKIKQSDIEYNVIEHPGLHMMLKKLIQYDNELLKKNESTFGETLISQLSTKILEEWVKFNRGCFLLIFLVENEAENIVCTLFSKLKPLAKNLKTMKSPGAQILLKKLKQR